MPTLRPRPPRQRNACSATAGGRSRCSGTSGERRRSSQRRQGADTPRQHRAPRAPASYASSANSSAPTTVRIQTPDDTRANRPRVTQTKGRPSPMTDPRPNRNPATRQPKPTRMVGVALRPRHWRSAGADSPVAAARTAGAAPAGRGRAAWGATGQAGSPRGSCWARIVATTRRRAPRLLVRGRYSGRDLRSRGPRPEGRSTVAA
jgi:hypothetical protein